MKFTRILFVALFVAVIGLAAVPSAQAAGLTTTPQTVTITEDQINASYWVTNPVLRSVSNKHVALGDGTVTISATITHKNGSVYNAQTVWKPYISNGVLVFGFQSATVNAVIATSTDRANLYWAHHDIVRDAIRDYIRKQVGGPFKYVSLTVTPGLITINVNVYSK